MKPLRDRVSPRGGESVLCIHHASLYIWRAYNLL